MVEIAILRHGEPLGGRRYRGSGVDDPLSEQGWVQMWSALENTGPWIRVVTSPMLRAKEFAKAYADSHDLPLQEFYDFREIGMGAWEGRSPTEVSLTDPIGYKAYYSDPSTGLPSGAEPLSSFYHRVTRALDTLEGPGPILIIAHAGVMRVAVAYALEGSLNAMMRIKVPYAGLGRFSHDDSGWSLCVS